MQGTYYRVCPHCQRPVRIGFANGNLVEFARNDRPAAYVARPTGGEMRPMRAEDRARNQPRINTNQAEFQTYQDQVMIDLTGGDETNTLLGPGPLSDADRAFLASDSRDRNSEIESERDPVRQARLRRLNAEFRSDW